SMLRYESAGLLIEFLDVLPFAILRYAHNSRANGQRLFGWHDVLMEVAVGIGWHRHSHSFVGHARQAGPRYGDPLCVARRHAVRVEEKLGGCTPVHTHSCLRFRMIGCRSLTARARTAGQHCQACDGNDGQKSVTLHCDWSTWDSATDGRHSNWH